MRHFWNNIRSYFTEPRVVIKPRPASMYEHQYLDPKTIEGLSRAVTGLLTSQGDILRKINELERKIDGKV